MCNAYRLRTPITQLISDMVGAGLPVDLGGSLPNLEARDSIRITETAPVFTAAPNGAELAMLRWSWPGPGGKPVYNFRSEGRRFGAGRCLIPTDGFYEFTDPEPPAPKRARKARWMFTMPGQAWFCIAGVLRPMADGTLAFSMLTVEPGPDVRPYHSRQVVVLEPGAWSIWLGDDAPERVLRPSPQGALAVERA